MKITGTLNAYLDTSITSYVVQFSDSMKEGKPSKAIDAMSLTTYDFEAGGDYAKIGTAVVTVDIDDKTDITKIAIEALREKQNAIIAQAHAMSADIDAKIQSLLALSFDDKGK